MEIFIHFQFVRPWLQRTHKNFFLIYIFTAITHIWIAMNGLLGYKNDFSSPALEKVNEFASHTTWGWASLVIGLGLLLGLFFKTFIFSRVFLGIGTCIMMFRFLLIAQAWSEDLPVANSLAYLFLIIGVHLTQTLEPPVNPETRRENVSN